MVIWYSMACPYKTVNCGTNLWPFRQPQSSRNLRPILCRIFRCPSLWEAPLYPAKDSLGEHVFNYIDKPDFDMKYACYRSTPHIGKAW
jgi:hypothetical protein